jgi:mRNA interferase RelE/StbE
MWLGTLLHVRYELLISEDAREQLRKLPDEVRRNIGYRLRLLQDDLAGDVKKLEGQRSHYRLRVGTFRILFRLNSAKIEVYAVKPRKDVYE